MVGWSTTSARAVYIETSLKRIDETCNQLEMLRSKLWEVSMLQTIGRTCHQLAGSSGFFDLAEFSQLAQNCERLMSQLMKKSSDLKSTDLDAVSEKLQRMAQILRETPDTASEAFIQAEVVLHDVIVVCLDTRLSLKLTLALEKLQFRPHVYRSVESAVQHFSSKNVAALVIATPLNGASPLNLLAEFRKHYPEKPVLLLSQEAHFLDRLSIIKLGIDGLFEPPFEHDAIAQRLSELALGSDKFMYRVLSVEDDPVQSEIISGTLQAAGYAVLSLLNPQGFEEAVISFNPDLILLDVDLGEISGFDLAKYTRKVDRLANIPIIFLTTRNQLESLTEGVRSGGDEYLVKPASVQYLVATITARIERYRAMQKLVERDGLTRLYTYSYFLMRCQQSLQAGGRNKSADLAMLCFDIDALGQINNHLGLAAGDRVIAAAAKVLRSVFRHIDLVGRTAGGEISILVNGLDSGMLAESCLFAIRQLLEAEVFPAEKGITLHMSVGIAPIAEDNCPLAALTHAREAMRLAKKSGRASVLKHSTEASRK